MRYATKSRVALTSFFALSLTAACGSSGSDADTTPGAGGTPGADPNCVTGEGFLCAPDDLKGFPFVAFAVSYSESRLMSSGAAPAGETTVTMSQPEPGKLCLAGRVKAEGLAGFNLELARRNADGTKILEPFDAASRGISQASLTVDTPPSGGVGLYMQMVRQLECADALSCTYPPNFGFMNLMTSGPVIAPFASFISDDPTVRLDTSVLANLLFQVGPGDYQFCIHDFEFLDADGNEVEP